MHKRADVLKRESEISAGQDTFILTFDIDNLSDINLEHGFDTGDRIIDLVFRTLCDVPDTRTYHTGTDEFVMFGHDITNEGRDLLQPLRADLAQKTRELGLPTFTMSEGLSWGNWDSLDDLTLMLYQSAANLRDAKTKILGGLIFGKYNPSLTREKLVELRKANRRITRDPLTQLMNRDEFFRQTGMVFSHPSYPTGKTSGFIYLDIDDFKIYNAEYGFSAGDELLVRIGAIIGDAFRDRLVSRFANDHFVVLDFADTIEENLNRLNTMLAKLSHAVSVSAGVYLHEEGTPYDIGCDRAKTACNVVKAERKNGRCYFDMSMETEQLRQNHIISNIERAIGEEWIQVYYQPVVRAHTGKLSGVEALCRWTDPKYGFLNPGEFIGVLEEAGKSAILDLAMLDFVCQDYARQKKAGLKFVHVSINLSRADFADSRFVQIIEQIVELYEVPASAIHFEITESALAKSNKKLLAAVKELRDYGFEIWMDDFGTGESSFKSLQRMPVDVVKLDHSFVSHITDSDEDKRFLNALIGMIKDLGICVLAEGVETQEQLEILESMGCDLIQGFYFDRPIPFNILNTMWLNKTRRIESDESKSYYLSISRIDMQRARLADIKSAKFPHADAIGMAIIEVVDDNLEIISANGPYKYHLDCIDGPNAKDTLHAFAHGTEFKDRFLKTAELCRRGTDPWRSMDFISVEGHYCMSRVRYLATDSTRNASAYLIIPIDLTLNSQLAQTADFTPPPIN